MEQILQGTRRRDHRQVRGIMLPQILARAWLKYDICEKGYLFVIQRSGPKVGTSAGPLKLVPGKGWVMPYVPDCSSPYHGNRETAYSRRIVSLQ